MFPKISSDGEGSGRPQINVTKRKWLVFVARRREGRGNNVFCRFDSSVRTVFIYYGSHHHSKAHVIYLVAALRHFHSFISCIASSQTSMSDD